MFKYLTLKNLDKNHYSSWKMNIKIKSDFLSLVLLQIFVMFYSLKFKQALHIVFEKYSLQFYP